MHCKLSKILIWICLVNTRTPQPAFDKELATHNNSRASSCQHQINPWNNNCKRKHQQKSESYNNNNKKVNKNADLLILNLIYKPIYHQRGSDFWDIANCGCTRTNEWIWYADIHTYVTATASASVFYSTRTKTTTQ